jgi:hypothetical protein
MGKKMGQNMQNWGLFRSYSQSYFRHAAAAAKYLPPGFRFRRYQNNSVNNSVVIAGQGHGEILMDGEARGSGRRFAPSLPPKSGGCPRRGMFFQKTFHGRRRTATASRASARRGHMSFAQGAAALQPAPHNPWPVEAPGKFPGLTPTPSGIESVQCCVEPFKELDAAVLSEPSLRGGFWPRKNFFGEIFSLFPFPAFSAVNPLPLN